MLNKIILISSVAQLCMTLCLHIDYSMPGCPVHHQLLEFTRVEDGVAAAGGGCPPSQSHQWPFPRTLSVSVQSLSRVRPFATPWTAVCQASLSITNSRSLLKPTSIELVMPSSHLILCLPLLLPPSIFPSIRVFSVCLLKC